MVRCSLLARKDLPLVSLLALQWELLYLVRYFWILQAEDQNLAVSLRICGHLKVDFEYSLDPTMACAAQSLGLALEVGMMTFCHR